MSVDNKQILFSEFIKNEVKTLGFIRGLASIKSGFPLLSGQAEIYYYQYKSKPKLDEEDFIFNCEMEMEIQGRKKNETVIFLEANIRRNFSESTYTLIMCENKTSKKLIRKFHFDYDPQLKPKKIKKPKYHMQYGGTPTPKINEYKIPMEYTWLSVPRLAIAPTNLALLLDLIFVEFPSEETNKIIEKSEWRKFIKSNESKILKKYYANLNSFLIGGHSSEKLLREYFYE